MDRLFEPVYTVTDYWDGPCAGVAEFGGAPHVYRSVFREDLDDWDPDRFELSPISAEVLADALEDWAIFLRWRAAFDSGSTTLETHPALPEDAARHRELASQLDRALRIDPVHRTLARANFRVCGSSSPEPRPGTMSPLEVQWTAVE